MAATVSEPRIASRSLGSLCWTQDRSVLYTITPCTRGLSFARLGRKRSTSALGLTAVASRCVIADEASRPQVLMVRFLRAAVRSWALARQYLRNLHYGEARSSGDLQVHDYRSSTQIDEVRLSKVFTPKYEPSAL